jgi:hypothetical protein
LVHYPHVLSIHKAPPAGGVVGIPTSKHTVRAALTLYIHATRCALSYTVHRDNLRTSLSLSDLKDEHKDGPPLHVVLGLESSLFLHQSDQSDACCDFFPSRASPAAACFAATSSHTTNSTDQTD